MKQVRQLVPEDVLLMAQQRHHRRVADLLNQGVDLAAPVNSTLQRLPSPARYLIGLVPSALSTEEFLDHTIEDEVLAAGDRLRICARCSTTAAACAREPVDPGQVPFWDRARPPSGAAGIGWKQCEKWGPYALDQRMLKWGFPAKLLRRGLAEFVTGTDALRAVKHDAEVFVESFYAFVSEGKGIGLYGSVGVGKTHVAVAVCRALLESRKIRDARFWQVAELLTFLRQEEDDARRRALHHAMTAGILVLDDLGVQRTTDWVREQVATMIDHRWRNNLPIIVTSNDALEVAGQTLGPRVLSRLIDATATVNIEAVDYRTRGVEAAP